MCERTHSNGGGSGVEDHGSVSLQERREANGELAIAPLLTLSSVVGLLTPWQELLVPAHTIFTAILSLPHTSPVEVSHYIIHSLGRVSQQSLL